MVNRGYRKRFWFRICYYKW